MSAYLSSVRKNSPALLKTALEMHQQGMIPPNTWVIDLDQIAENASYLADRADELGLKTYLMSKQHNRNPYINAIAQSRGLGGIVAVDFQGALACRRYGIALGHVGHLNQIPRHLVETVLEEKPEVWTVYSIENARWINDAAEKKGIVQKLLIRVFDRDNGDIAFDGQEAGIEVGEFRQFLTELARLPGVKAVGVTAFPAVRYNEKKEDCQELTPNCSTLFRAVEMMKETGIEVEQINAPGNTYSENLHLLKEAQVTHVEPGNGLLGTAPGHAFHHDLPEKTAFAYVTEISHYFDGRAYALGGGVYHTDYSDRIEGLVGRTWNDAKDNRIGYKDDIVQDIDYHMQLLPKDGQKCAVGDSVLFAYRTQMHMTRSYVAPVSGLSGKRPLKLHYLFDNAVNPLDRKYNQVPVEDVRRDLSELLKTY